MVFARMREAVIPFLFPRYSYHLITETWIYSTHASWFYKKPFRVLVGKEEKTMISDVVLKKQNVLRLR